MSNLRFVPKSGNMVARARMRVVGYEKIQAFRRRHPDAKASLTRWHSMTVAATWRNFPDVRRTFPTADHVGRCVVFDIAGNKYRLIGKVDYELQAVTVQCVLSHKEYDKDAWKKDC